MDLHEILSGRLYLLLRRVLGCDCLIFLTVYFTVNSRHYTELTTVSILVKSCISYGASHLICTAKKVTGFYMRYWIEMDFFSIILILQDINDRRKS